MLDIKKVVNEEMAVECDNLLTKLIQSDRRFDNNMKETYCVSNYYTDKYLKDSNVLYVAYANQKPIGYIYGYIKYPTGNYVHSSVAQIDSLYVEKDYRKQGVATNLMNEFYDWCKNNSVKYVEICVFKDNNEAYNLYTHHGFELEIYHMKKEL